MRSLIFGLVALLLSPFVLANNLIIEVSASDTKTVSFEQLKSMPSVTYKTHLPWFEGEAEFTGVPLTDFLISFYGKVPAKVTFRALNDYSISILKADIEKYSPIIAYYRDGKPMAVRDKGPYWVIYSLSEHPEIDNSHYHSQMIWQLAKINIDD